MVGEDYLWATQLGRLMSVERSTLLLSADDVAACLDMGEAIAAVREAFVAYHAKRAVMPPKSYINLPEHGGDVRSMPAKVGTDALSVKWICSHPKNPERHGLPTVIGSLILSDPATGWPLAVMDATLLTAYRTGAAAAVASDTLARRDATTLGIIGAGTQAAYQIAAISHVRKLTRVTIADARIESTQRLVEALTKRAPHLDVRAGTLEEAAGEDIVCTLTPVHTPIVKRDWIGHGVHINALGADAAGKQELEVDILRDAVIVVDDWEQATHSGEINVAMAAADLRPEHVRGTLGAILDGALPGRSDDEEITIFDSTGLAIQDTAVAKAVYARAVRDGLGTPVDLVNTARVPFDAVLTQMRT